MHIKQIKLLSFNVYLFNDRYSIKSSKSNTFVHIIPSVNVVNVNSKINIIYKSLLK